MTAGARMRRPLQLGTSSRISGIDSACPARIEVWQAVLTATASSHDSP